MKVTYQPRVEFPFGEIEPACLYLEPESDRDRETLTKLLDKHPGSIVGMGKDCVTWQPIYVELRLEER